MISKLSYSSLQTFKSCQRRWHYRKIEKLPEDSNYKESESLLFGKAYHQSLEDCLHNPELFTNDMFKKAITDFNQKENAHAIFACIQAYFQQGHKQAIACEYELEHDRIIGYIDAIIPYQDGWAILDLKTARSLANDLQSRLAKDAQLNLYASFVNDIAKKYDLNAEDFKGCVYNVALKPYSKVKDGESLMEYSYRSGARNIDLFIAKQYLNPQYFRDEVEATYAKMERIQQSGDLPECNYSACYSYFSPCPYWSRCYGAEYDASSIVVKNEVTLDSTF